MTASLYLTVYAGNDLPTSDAEVTSKSLGTVNAAIELEYRAHLHGTGSGSVKINRYHSQAALLQQDRYVLVHSDAGVVGGFFLDSGDIGLTDQNGKGAEFLVWSGVGPMGVLRNGTMDADSNITGGHDPIDGYWDLDDQGPLAGDSNAHPIPMMKRVLVEMDLNSPNGIAVVDHSSWTYDTDSASASVPFLDGEAQGAAVGDTGLDLIARFDQLGGVVFVMSPLFKLDAYLTFGTDRSGAFAADTVRFEKGVNIAAAVQRKVRGAVNRTHLTVEGADKTFVTVTDPDYTAGDIVRWGYLSVPETSNTDQLTAAGLQHIALRKRQTDAWTFPQHDHGDDPANGIYEPAPDIADGHYWLGDSVALHTGSGAYDANEETVPIAAITWQLKKGREASSDYWVIPEVGSTFLWSAGDASFTSNITPVKDNRLCYCTTTISGGEVVTGYEGPWTWDSGQETIANAYPSGTAQMLLQTTASGPEPGAAGTAYCGGFGSSPSNSIAVTPGDALRISGFVQFFGESFPTTAHGFVNGSWGVKFYTSGDVLISTHTVASYANVAQDGPFHGPDTLNVTVPATAAYMQFAQHTDGTLADQQNNTKIDQVNIGIVTTTDAVKGTDEFTGSEACAARCDHKHHADEVVLDNGDTVEEWFAEGAGAHTHNAVGVNITDDGGYFTGTTVEAALQELGGGTITLQDIEAQHRFILCAHRGDINPDDGYPENTLEAVRQAVMRGAHEVELDVQQTSDDIWMLLHDETLTRTTNLTDDINDVTAATVEAGHIDGGYGYDAGRHGTSLVVPRLIDVLDAIRPYDCVVNFDLKDPVAASNTALAEFIIANWYVERSIINTKSLTQAAAIKAVDSRLVVMAQTGVTSSPQTEDDVDIWLAERTEVTSMSDVTSRAPDRVDLFFDVTTDYGDDESTWISDAFDYGVRAILTNDLPAAQAALNEYLGLTSSPGAAAFDELTDVTITAAVAGEMPRWNGSAWVNDAGLICVDPGSIAVDNGDPFGVTLTTVWGIDAGTPYYDDANAAAGEEAALFFDPLTNDYVLIAYDF